MPRDGLRWQPRWMAAAADGAELTYTVADEIPHLPLAAQAARGATARRATRPRISNGGAILELADAGDFEHDQPFTVACWVKLPANDSVGARRGPHGRWPAALRGWDLWVQGRRVGMHLIHDWPERRLQGDGPSAGTGRRLDPCDLIYDGSRQGRRVRIYFNGQLAEVNIEVDNRSDREHDPHRGAAEDRQRHRPALIAGVGPLGLADLRPATLPGRGRPRSPRPARSPTSQKPVDQRNRPNSTQSLRLVARQLDDAVLPAHDRRTTRSSASSSDIKSRGTVAHVMQERSEPPKAYVLDRGEYDQTRRRGASPTRPRCLPPLPDDLPRNRLGLARWLLLPEHPLTARVTVNRFWQEVFGTGLVRTAGDFGVTGELPSHPELLDWLAVDFREARLGRQAAVPADA